MFLYPQFLYSLPLLIVVLTLLYMASRRNRRRRIQKLAELQNLPQAASNHSVTRSRLKLLFNLGGILLLFVALARPQFGFEWVEQRKTIRTIIFVLDVSRSTLVEDIFPNRLKRAKLVIHDLARQYPDSGHYGLLIFSGGVFLQCPPTEDIHAFLETVKIQSPDMMTQQGTDFSNVLMSIPELVTNRENDIVILISDGEDHSTRLMPAIRYLQNESVTVHTVCVGTSEGGLIPNPGDRRTEPYFIGNHGSVVFSRANPEMMAAIASALGGVTVHLHSERASIRPIHDLLEASDIASTAALSDKRIPVEHYQIPLFAALFLLLIDLSLGTRKLRTQTERS